MKLICHNTQSFASGEKTARLYLENDGKNYVFQSEYESTEKKLPVKYKNGEFTPYPLNMVYTNGWKIDDEEYIKMLQKELWNHND